MPHAAFVSHTLFDQCPPVLLTIGGNSLLLYCVRNARARRYVLRVRPDGTVRVTIPRGGSVRFATEFTLKNRAWVEQQLQKRKAEREVPRAWTHGTSLLFRGEPVAIQAQVQNGVTVVQFADQVLSLRGTPVDIRPNIEAHLWVLAEKELVPRTLQLASQYGARPSRVVVRNQRSRWGSCSTRGTISLNWRVMQAPPAVRDYLIIHELMHLQQMNHSPRFWDLVQAACPTYPLAERWLDDHESLLR